MGDAVYGEDRGTRRIDSAAYRPQNTHDKTVLPLARMERRLRGSYTLSTDVPRRPVRRILLCPLACSPCNQLINKAEPLDVVREEGYESPQTADQNTDAFAIAAAGYWCLVPGSAEAGRPASLGRAEEEEGLISLTSSPTFAHHHFFYSTGIEHESYISLSQGEGIFNGYFSSSLVHMYIIPIMLQSLPSALHHSSVPLYPALTRLQRSLPCRSTPWDCAKFHL